jgi:hypothetical protein
MEMDVARTSRMDGSGRYRRTGGISVLNHFNWSMSIKKEFNEGKNSGGFVRQPRLANGHFSGNFKHYNLQLRQF